MLRIILCFLILCTTSVLSQHAWGDWSAFTPSATAPTRERSRNCSSDIPTDCINNYYSEKYTDCFDARCGMSISPFGSKVTGACTGLCDMAIQVSTFTCPLVTTCTLMNFFHCTGPCDGEWASWSYTSCSQNCNSGTRTKTRICKDTSGNTVNYCLGGRGSSTQIKTEACNTMTCPVYAPWSVFSTCSVSCNNGTHSRTRNCLEANGPSTTGIGCGANNLITETDQQFCNVQSCPYYSAWVNGSCSTSCAVGTTTDTRSCVYQGASSSLCPGAAANGVQSITSSCNLGPCPAWTQWVATTPCTATCGNAGSQTLSRSCLAGSTPSVLCPGAGGSSTATQSVSCNVIPCPSYSSFVSTTPCNQTCSSGAETFTKTCMFNGAVSSACVDGTTVSEVRACNTQACQFGSVIDVSSCTASCGGGTVNQVQQCITPGCHLPNITSTRNCNTNACGNTWVDTSNCTVVCGNGTKTQQRNSCAPLSVCPLNDTRTVNCVEPACQFGSVIDVSSCTASCGGGTVNQVQQCITPGCHLPNITSTRVCNTFACWNASWFDTSNCTVVCGNGTKTQGRNCNPLTGCTPNDTRTVNCVEPTCQFGSWINSSACSVTCGGGVQQQIQQCITPGCHLPNNTRNVVCNTQQCAMGPWFDISNCSSVCGAGTKQQQRNCNPGNNCSSANETRTANCTSQPCTFGSWNDTSACSVTCGGGTKTQERLCNIIGCNITETRTTSCNENTCTSVTAGFSNLPLLIVIAAIAGGALLSAVVYMLVGWCCGAAAGAAGTRSVTATSAFCIYTIQTGALGMILWRGQTKLKVSSSSSTGCCGGGSDDNEGADNVPMVRLFGKKKGTAAMEAGMASTSAAAGNVAVNNEDVGLQELTNWAEQMIADSSNINETDVYDLNNQSNNNCIWAINDDRIHVTHYAWVHTRSFSGQRPLSTFQPLARSTSHTYAVMQ